MFEQGQTLVDVRIFGDKKSSSGNAPGEGLPIGAESSHDWSGIEFDLAHDNSIERLKPAESAIV